MIAVEAITGPPPLNAGGWTVMIACITLVLALSGFCFWRVMRGPSRTEHLHGPLDIDTQDVEE